MPAIRQTHTPPIGIHADDALQHHTRPRCLNQRLQIVLSKGKIAANITATRGTSCRSRANISTADSPSDEDTANEITIPALRLACVAKLAKSSSFAAAYPPCSRNGVISATMKGCGRASRTVLVLVMFRFR